LRVVVVGSGLVGVTTAWFLVREGCEVTVIEREAEPAKGTSHANAGMLTPSMADPWNAPGVFWHLIRWIGKEDAPFLLRPGTLPSIFWWGLSFVANSRPAKFRANMAKNLALASYSLEVLKDLRQSLDLAFEERDNGTLTIFRRQDDFDFAQDRFRHLAQLGLNVNVLTPAQSTQLDPSLQEVQDKLVGGIHCPADGSGDARMFTLALAQRAREKGAKFLFGTSVQRFEHDGRRIARVITDKGAHEADVFVAAAGSWNPLLLEGLGIRLPVRPVKGYSITVPCGAWSNSPGRPIIDAALHAAITPLGDRLRVAGTAEFAGYDTSLAPGRINNLFDLLLSVYPSFGPHLDRSVASPWAGLRPVSADGVPRIGRMKFENLYVNAGHGHLGWTFCAGSGQMLADLVRGKASAIDARPYDAERN
jgi:D-amino-acid dehydrogenase